LSAVRVHSTTPALLRVTRWFTLHRRFGSTYVLHTRTHTPPHTVVLRFLLPGCYLHLFWLYTRFDADHARGCGLRACVHRLWTGAGALHARTRHLVTHSRFTHAFTTSRFTLPHTSDTTAFSSRSVTDRHCGCSSCIFSADGWVHRISLTHSFDVFGSPSSVTARIYVCHIYLVLPRNTGLRSRAFSRTYHACTRTSHGFQFYLTAARARLTCTALHTVHTRLHILTTHTCTLLAVTLPVLPRLSRCRTRFAAVFSSRFATSRTPFSAPRSVALHATLYTHLQHHFRLHLVSVYAHFFFFFGYVHRFARTHAVPRVDTADRAVYAVGHLRVDVHTVLTHCLYHACPVPAHSVQLVHISFYYVRG